MPGGAASSRIGTRCLAALAALWCLAAAAHPIQPAQLREDLRVMRAALAESHAGLHWYLSRHELEQRFETVAGQLSQPLTAREFHRLLLPVVAAIQHGHTTLELPSRWAGYRLKLHADGRYLPLEVRAIGNRLFVVTDLSEAAEVPAGSEITAIDGRPVAELLEQFHKHLSADGGSDTYKRFQLGPGFQFAHLLELLHGPLQLHQLDLISPAGGASGRKRVAAESPARMTERYRQRTGRELDRVEPPVQLERLAGKTARLTIAAFIDGRPGFGAALAAAFSQIKAAAVEDLILDVRGNGGGNGDYAPLLYSYLADQPFRQASPTAVASASMSFLSHAETPSDSVKAFAADPKAFLTKGQDGGWVLKPEIDGERYREFAPQPDRFHGRLWVLVDGGSFSATNQFLDLVYRYHRGAGRAVRFVGEANGGDTHIGRDSGGQTLRLVLPYSQQRLNIPLLAFRQFFAAPSSQPAIPDAHVRPTVQDLVLGVDRELLFVLEAIAQAQRR